MSTIVVGVDGSECARTALRFAAAEARLRGAELLALRIVPTGAGAAASLAGATSEAIEHARSGLEADLAAEAAGVAVTPEVRAGHPAEELVRAAAAAGAELLVVGSRGHGGFHTLLIGSVGLQCLQHAACPVAVVRTVPDRARGRILVGVDGSASSMAAFRWAVDEATRREAALAIVHAWLAPSWLAAPGPIAPVPAPADFDESHSAATELVAGLAAQAPPELEVERVVAPGNPAVALVDRSRDADLLVLGSRGLGGFAGLLLGSVSHQCAHHAECPVVVVRRVTEEDAGATAGSAS